LTPMLKMKVITAMLIWCIFIGYLQASPHSTRSDENILEKRNFVMTNEELAAYLAFVESYTEDLKTSKTNEELADILTVLERCTDYFKKCYRRKGGYFQALFNINNGSKNKRITDECINEFRKDEWDDVEELLSG